MEITIAGQTQLFLISILLGAALGICYDFFRILRIAIEHSSAAVLVEDLLFSIVCTFSTFAYLLITGDGTLRIFMLLGEAAGFAFYYCTVGVVVIGAARGIIGVIKKVWGILKRIFINPFVRIFKKIWIIWVNIRNKSTLCIKKKMKISAIPLKKHRDLLYNLRRRLQPDRRIK